MHTIWLTLLFPLLGALFCATHYRSVGKTATGLAASLAVFGAFLASLYQWELLHHQSGFVTRLAPWLQIPGVSGLDFAALVDPLSVTMLCTVTGVGFLIHCYSMGYMADEEDYGRFFACLNLFVATMVCLVLASNLGLMLVGWGGVGFASYSLIGFYRHKPSAVSAARKAFLVNVVGDVGMLLALVALASRLGAVDFQTFLLPESLELLRQDVLFIAVMLLVAAYAKSAQLLFHTWLPDAMEGPTPVSALIHAATMVTAGVYLLVRCFPLFSYGEAGTVLLPIIAIFGAVTALTAACCAMIQNDLKRILAYSTMSQLGYMFMAVGVGACSAAMFHLVTHAFFKALLFLTAGVVIHALHGQQDIRQMGGLARPMKGAHLAFLLGALALAGVPLTAGFFSKEAILLATYEAALPEARALWAIGLVTALLTAYYTGRAYRLTFLARPASQEERHLHLPSSSMTWPLAVLACLTLVAGFAQGEFVYLLEARSAPHHAFGLVELLAVGASLLGLGLAWISFKGFPPAVERLLGACETIDGLSKILAAYFRRLAGISADKIDPVFTEVAPSLVQRSLHSTSQMLCSLQSGGLRAYVLGTLAACSLLAAFVYLLLRVPGGGAQ